jgi:hypothetical protein
MYCNDHKASRLKKKMKLVFGKKDQAGSGVHSLIPRKVYNKHKNDFQNPKLVAGIWISDSEALVEYR